MAQSQAFRINIRVFAALQQKVKYYLIDIENITSTPQKVLMRLIAKIVLGITEEKTNRHLLPEWKEEENCFYFNNVYNNTFRDTRVFLTSSEKIISYEEINPSNKGIEIETDIPEMGSKQLAFMIGCCNNGPADISRSIPDIEKEYNKVKQFWKEKLSVIKVNTPDTSFNFIMNSWLLYQTYTARLLARSGFYQVGGAFGFRDQLQDCYECYVCDPYCQKPNIKTCISSISRRRCVALVARRK